MQILYDFYRDDALKWFNQFVSGQHIETVFDIIKQVRQLAFPVVIFTGVQNRHEKTIDPIIFGFMDPIIYNLME